MLSDQITAQVRQVLTAIGALLVTLGIMSPEAVGSKISFVMTIVGPAMVAASSLWSIQANLKATQIAAVNAMPEVEGVVTKNTMAGRELAKTIPDKTVAVAGTADAIAIAKPAGVTL